MKPHITARALDSWAGGNKTGYISWSGWRKHAAIIAAAAEPFAVGDEVLVIYFEPPQTVYVDELPDVLRHGEDG